MNEKDIHIIFFIKPASQNRCLSLSSYKSSFTSIPLPAFGESLLSLCRRRSDVREQPKLQVLLVQTFGTKKKLYCPKVYSFANSQRYMHASLKIATVATGLLFLYPAQI